MRSARWLLLAVPLILFWTAGTAEAAGSPGCNLPPPASVPEPLVAVLGLEWERAGDRIVAALDAAVNNVDRL